MTSLPITIALTLVAGSFDSGQPVAPVEKEITPVETSELPPGAMGVLFFLFQARHHRLAAEEQDCGRVQARLTQELNARYDRLSERLRLHYGEVTDRILSAPRRPVRAVDVGCRSGAILNGYRQQLDSLESFADLLIPAPASGR